MKYLGYITDSKGSLKFDRNKEGLQDIWISGILKGIEGPNPIAGKTLKNSIAIPRHENCSKTVAGTTDYDIYQV